MSDSFALAADQLRELDRDRYAASLVIPAAHRSAVQSIFAFSAEIAAVRERVSEPVPGEIRLQWWVDAIEGEGHGAIVSNPVADALFRTLERYELPSGPLLRLLAARRFDLYHDPMPDIGQFEGYAGETVSVLYQYAAMILAGGSVDRLLTLPDIWALRRRWWATFGPLATMRRAASFFCRWRCLQRTGARGRYLRRKGQRGVARGVGTGGRTGADACRKGGTRHSGTGCGIRPAFASLALVKADVGGAGPAGRPAVYGTAAAFGVQSPLVRHLVGVAERSLRLRASQPDPRARGW